MLRKLLGVGLLIGLAAAPTHTRAQASGPTRMLRSPTVSATQIAFEYAGDIWIVDRNGGSAHRLTSFQGEETNPHFSPDGRQVAFSAVYGGGTDVYVVPAAGGEPRRLTWHPDADLVQGWTPDGKNVLFTSGRATWAPSPAPRFWTVPAAGGVPQAMALPRGYQGKISPDGKFIAYRMNNSWDDNRRNYRGGQNRPIWIVDLKTYDLVSPPWKDSKDIDPAWIGKVVDFISDRDGVANLWSYDPATKALAQVTHFTDFDVKTLDSGGGGLVFEQGFQVHALDPATGRQHVVPITATGDFPWMMPHWAD
ncbi:MAG: protease, partial [Gemmatimonadota bacterium]